MDGDKRFSYVRVDASKKEEIANVLKSADYVVDTLPEKYVYNFMDAVKEVGISGVSLNMIDVDKLPYYSAALEKAGKTFLIGNGGCATTCEMAKLGCEEMDEVDDINIYWGMWRPITHGIPRAHRQTRDIYLNSLGAFNPSPGAYNKTEENKTNCSEGDMALQLDTIRQDLTGKRHL